MENRISAFYDDRQRRNDHGPQPIGEILVELLALYEARFPEAHIAVLETPVAATLVMEDCHACACPT